MASERFSVSWDDFHKNMSLGVHSLLEKEDFVDVTLAVEGRYLKAHKIVLSVCSPYFRELFRTSPCKHPIVFMKDVSYIVMSDLLQFMYQGEVQISKENFNIFLKTAESLQISGLSNYSNGIPGRGGDKVLKPPDPEICNSQKETRETPLSPPLKRIHLNKSHAPLQHEVVKTEPEAIPYHAGEELIMLKTEPEEPNTTTMEDNVSENFFEDSQEGANMDDMNDWMMEGEDGEPQASTSTDLTLGDDLDASLIRRESGISSLPAKSKESYEKAYSNFIKWCKTAAVDDYTENVMLAYFLELSKVHKASSLWSYYSKIKSTLLIYHNVDISKFTKLLAFLKGKCGSYKPTRPKILSRDQVLRFLSEAPDDIYLMTKVAAIMGIAGALRCQDLLQISLDDIEDEGTTLFVNIKNSGRSFHIWNPKDTQLDFIELYRKYLSLRPVNTNHKRFFIFYKNGKCSSQVVGKNRLGKIPAMIAEFLKLPDSKLYTGHCLRRSSATY